MIELLTQAWPEIEEQLRLKYSQKAPGSYDGIFKDLVNLWPAEYEWDNPDPDRITVIDHGDYQGTRVFIVGARGYQPSKYWICKVSYGSCSGCDAFEAIRGYSDETPTEQQVKDYVTLAMHMLQAFKEV